MNRNPKNYLDLALKSSPKFKELRKKSIEQCELILEEFLYLPQHFIINEDLGTSKMRLAVIQLLFGN